MSFSPKYCCLFEILLPGSWVCLYFRSFWKSLCPVPSYRLLFTGKEKTGSWQSRNFPNHRVSATCITPEAKISIFSKSSGKLHSQLTCAADENQALPACPPAAFPGHTSVWLFLLWVFVCSSFLFFPFFVFWLSDIVPWCLKIQPNHGFSVKRNCRNNLCGFVALNSWQSPRGLLGGAHCRTLIRTFPERICSPLVFLSWSYSLNFARPSSSGEPLVELAPPLTTCKTSKSYSQLLRAQLLKYKRKGKTFDVIGYLWEHSRLNIYKST